MNIAGHTVKPPVLIAGIGGVAVVLFFYRKNKASSAAQAPATVDASNTGSSLSQPGSTDASGYVGTAGSPAPGVSFSSASQSFANNAAWAQAAQAGLAQIGYDPPTVGDALGAYLSRKPLSASQASIAQTAVAEFGPPPVGQFSIVQQGNGTTTGVGHTGHPELPAPAHIHVTNKTAHEFSLAWDAVPGAQGYHVQVKQLNGKVIADFHVPGPGCTVSANTHPGYTYHVGIQALPGGVGSNITVSLPK